MLAACGAPSIDSPLDTDNIRLPERGPLRTDAGSSSGDGGTKNPTPDALTLTVTLAGSGAAIITSTPTGVTCSGTTCKGSFARGTSVALTVAPAAGSVFAGWSGGACTGSGACAALVDRDVAISAAIESLEGAWTGTYTNTRVANGCTFNNAGSLSVTVTAAGAVLSDTANVTGLELRQAPCQLVGTTTGAAPSAGLTATGSTVTGTWTFAVQGANGSLPFPFTGTVSTKTIAGSWTCPTCTGSFKLTKP